jgi:hypothetical protein
MPQGMKKTLGSRAQHPVHPVPRVLAFACIPKFAESLTKAVMTLSITIAEVATLRKSC